MGTLNRNPRDKVHNAHGRLFQAAMWRGYVQDWDLKPEIFGKTALVPLRRQWVERVLKISRAECLRRAQVNVRLARRLNRRGEVWTFPRCTRLQIPS